MKSTLLPALVIAAFAAPAVAGDEGLPIFNHPHLAAADNAHVQADAWKRWADDFSREMRTSMGTMFAGRVAVPRLVKGAPYSAQVVTETNQALADGNVITHRTTGAVYRDAEGRTRQETGADNKERTVVIDDPVEQKHIVLVPGAKRAVETRARMRGEKVKSKQVVKVDGTEIRVEDGKVTIDGKEVPQAEAHVRTRSGKEVSVENGRVFIDGKEVGPAPGGTGTQVVMNTITAGDSPDGIPREEVRVQVVRAGRDGDIPMPPIPPAPPAPPAMPGFHGPGIAPMPPMPPMPGVQTMRFESLGHLGKGTTTSLGTKEFEGVKAEGKQTVWTIAAGAIGNRNPINVTSESWYSPDLQVTVYSRYSDPRTGESIYRLTGIRRSQPPAELFRVPADYEVKDRRG